MASTAQHLRNRAWRVRAIAQHLDSAPLLSLDVYAGTDTWQCAAADEFLLAIMSFQDQVLGAAEDLRWQAWDLEQRAERQEAADAAELLLGAT